MTTCTSCNGTGTEADYVGLEMKCIEVECSSCKGTCREPSATGTQIHRLEQYLKDFDNVIDEEHIARSCINPLEDLRIAIRSMKAQLAERQAQLKTVLDRESTTQKRHDDKVAELEAKLAQARKEALTSLISQVCSRCRSELPTIEVNGFLMHIYHAGSDYRECYAAWLHALIAKETP